ncbi:MAG: cation:proton antiporter [Alphaproteobacteria bacterium HGW-Alphaproteobacteria-11]|nr:MAG: cation:proton antiporter [Alphaproteobacteria bacterium HGW-Alphaproteobacteria-11]
MSAGLVGIAVIDILLFLFLVLIAIAIARLRNLFAIAMLAGVFSLLSAGLFVTLDAMDVAFTEAAVGAGISTVLMLGTLALTVREEKPVTHSPFLPLLVCAITGAALIYGTLDMPPFGAADNPVQTHVAPYYLEQTPVEIGIPNAVAAVLASYRGFDTLGEVVVVFTAAIAVLLLLGGGGRSGRHGKVAGERKKD